MRSIPIVGSILLLTSALLHPAAAWGQTPLRLVVEGSWTAGSTSQIWPSDPARKQELRFTVSSVVKASSPEATAPAALVDYFKATAAEAGFVVSNPQGGETLVRWQGRGTNQQGFLLQFEWSGRRTGVVSETPPVIALEGAAEIRGLSGRGRGIGVTGRWSGQFNTATGAVHLEFAGDAAGPLGPPPVVCGSYTDEGLAGEIQPLMRRPDGSPNQDHFRGSENDPYPHPFPYSTNPPTSGPHYSAPVPPGIYDTPQDDEWLVHNLEHGHVLVTYQPSASTAAVARLKALVSLYDGDVVMAPRPANDALVALSSWGRMQKFTEFDEPAIQNFIDRNRGHGPECLH